MKLFGSLVAAVAAIPATIACDGCYGPQNAVVLTRNIRRMQPDASNATSGPKGPLEWGQLNVLQTTDTHGWLEGHIKEQNYGADWGDFVSFVDHMRSKASALDVDLLLVDTGVILKPSAIRGDSKTNRNRISTTALVCPMPLRLTD